MAIKDRSTLKTDVDNTIRTGVTGGILAVSDNVIRNDQLDSVITFRDDAHTEAFSEEILFNDQRNKFIEHQLAGNLSFTLATTGNIIGAMVILTLLPDNTSTISFSSDFVDINSDNFTDFDNRFVNKIFMYYDTDGKAYVSIKPLLLPILPTITNLAAVATGLDVDLTWDAPSGNAAYLSLERSLTPSTGFTEIAQPTAAAISYQDQGLIAGTTYYYRIREIGDGVNYVTGDYSNEANVTVSPPIDQPEDVIWQDNSGMIVNANSAQSDGIQINGKVYSNQAIPNGSDGWFEFDVGDPGGANITPFGLDDYSSITDGAYQGFTFAALLPTAGGANMAASYAGAIEDSNIGVLVDGGKYRLRIVSGTVTIEYWNDPNWDVLYTFLNPATVNLAGKFGSHSTPSTDKQCNNARIQCDDGLIHR